MTPPADAVFNLSHTTSRIGQSQGSAPFHYLSQFSTPTHSTMQYNQTPCSPRVQCLNNTCPTKALASLCCWERKRRKKQESNITQTLCKPADAYLPRAFLVEFLLGPDPPLPATPPHHISEERQRDTVGHLHGSAKTNQIQVGPQVDSGTFLDEIQNITVCTGSRQRSFLREVMPVGR